LARSTDSLSCGHMAGCRAKVSDAGAPRNKLNSTLPLFPDLRDSHRVDDSTACSNSKHSMASNIVSHFKASFGFRGPNNDNSGRDSSVIETFAEGESQSTKGDASFTSPQGSASIPFKARRGSIQKKQESVCTDECSFESDEDNLNNNGEQLKRLYDMRTWDMYTRITEARKRSKPPSVLIAHARSIPNAVIPANSTAFSGDVHQMYDQQDGELDNGYFIEDDSSSTHSSEHEMVFPLED
jgi:hypothetical protein